MVTNIEIEALRSRIADLPRGTVVYKTIRGRPQPYLQWYEDGKTRSRYLKVGEREGIISAVEERRALESELEALEDGLAPRAVEESVVSGDSAFEMSVVAGSALDAMVEQVAAFDRRDCYGRIESHLRRNDARVCILYGLRRTGKTTLLLQAAAALGTERARAAYVKAAARDDLARLNRDVKRLQSLGYRYLFIDEVTLLEDFVDGASLLSDIFAAQGLRIVLSGTDSLGFWLSLHDELYDRATTIHTTFIPFREHARLLGIHDVDDYIAHGGTLRQGEVDFDDPELVSGELAFADDESTRRYIDSAICRNIQHSLACYEGGGHFRHLKELYRADELTNAINRIIEDMNHEFVVDVVTRAFTSHDYALTARNLRRSSDPRRRSDALDFMDREAITARLMQLLDIRKSDDLTVDVSEAVVREIREYLEALDLIGAYEIMTATGGAPQKRVVFTQPGMRFCQAQALVHVLTKDEYFSQLGQFEADAIVKALLDEVRGRMLEDIVLFETISVLSKGKSAFKLQFDAGEFDMVVYDHDRGTCRVYEVKHTAERFSGQARHLLDRERCAQCERRFGPIEERVVIYRGPSGPDENGVQYKNAAEYLTELGCE